MDLKDLKLPAIPISVSAVYGVVEGLRLGNTDLVASALGTISIGVLCGAAIYVYSVNAKKNKYSKSNQYSRPTYKKRASGPGGKSGLF